jgi:hypothetical protein
MLVRTLWGCNWNLQCSEGKDRICLGKWLASIGWWRHKYSAVGICTGLVPLRGLVMKPRWMRCQLIRFQIGMRNWKGILLPQRRCQRRVGLLEVDWYYKPGCSQVLRPDSDHTLRCSKTQVFPMQRNQCVNHKSSMGKSHRCITNLLEEFHPNSDAVGNRAMSD